MAGIIGIEPGPFTLRELQWMAIGRQRAEWDRTAMLCAITVNSNPYRKGRPIEPQRFNPYAGPTRRRSVDKFVSMSELKGILFPGEK